ncbi:MAG: dynamin family protein [Caldilineaceae bacterium]|nr:dynamin family protein [Caldilineaceae bacterium]
MHRLLTAEQDKILRQERSLLESLLVTLARLDAPEADLDLIRQSLRQLEEMFLLVIVGEFNAGKSAVINALMGERYLIEGVVPTTSQLHLLRYGPQVTKSVDERGVVLLSLPVDWLKEVNLVDTPGTNAVIRQHEAITEHFVPRSDLVLFVTSADRPFSESERSFLERIRNWGKKIVVIVNKFDLLQTDDERQQVLDFVATNGRELLGVEPQIFPVSARLALRAKENGQGSSDWESSRFEALERYILHTLDSTERVRLKLDNPLGVADRLIHKYQTLINDRQELLRGDFQTLDTIEENLTAYTADMRRDFRYQSSRVDNVLYEMIERGDHYFDETLRVTRILDLVNSEKLRGEFERQVVGDTSRQIEQHVNDLIDWLVDKDYRQWQSVVDFINRRASQHTERMLGQVTGEFEFSRQTLLKSVGRSAREIVDSYDREAEAVKLAQEVQRAIMQTAAVQVGALGLGAILVTVLHTTLLDVTGILSASAMAALGLYVLPYRRGRIKIEMRQRINELRGRLDAALTRQFEAELNQSVRRIHEAIAPYTRFVRVEREKLNNLTELLRESSQQLAGLHRNVQELQ